MLLSTMASANTNTTSTSRRKDTRDNEDISCIISPYYSSTVIKSPICSSEMKQVLLERLQKEIINKLGKSRGMKRKRGDNNKPSLTITESVVRSRFVCGINQCTRALENDDDLHHPSLIILARDVRPATIFEHISLYAHIKCVPILILPGRASLELGEAVGIMRVAAICFLPRKDDSSLTFRDTKTKMDEWKESNIDVDAFISYVISKIPS